MRGVLFTAAAVALLVQATPAGQQASTTSLGQSVDTIADLEQRISSDADDHEARTRLAALYLEVNRIDEAVTQLQTALRLEPEYALAHYNLGFALALGGHRDEALAAYQRAVTIRPDYAAARSNLGAMLQAQGRLPEAAEQFRLTLESDPDNPGARFNLGLLLQMQGDASGAIEQFRLALEIAPTDAETHSSLAQVLASQNTLDEAVVEYLLALETMPNLLSAVVNLAWLRATAPVASVRDTDEAVMLAERAAGLTERQNFIVMDTLGAAYASAGRFDDAIAAANTAIALAQAESEDAAVEQIQTRATLYLTYRPFRTSS